jgi:hypothetical protein
MHTINHHTSQFEQAAARYFELIESAASLSRRQFIERALVAVADLFRLALSLPRVKPDTADGAPDQVSKERWWSIHNQLGAMLGDANAYWMVFDPADTKDHEAIVSTLSDDLADIYRDLKASIEGETQKIPTSDELWDLRFSFETHWGQHAVSALSAMHALLYGPTAIID